MSEWGSQPGNLRNELGEVENAVSLLKQVTGVHGKKIVLDGAKSFECSENENIYNIIVVETATVNLFESPDWFDSDGTTPYLWSGEMPVGVYSGNFKKFGITAGKVILFVN